MRHAWNDPSERPTVIPAGRRERRRSTFCSSETGLIHHSISLRPGGNERETELSLESFHLSRL